MNDANSGCLIYLIYFWIDHEWSVRAFVCFSFLIFVESPCSLCLGIVFPFFRPYRPFDVCVYSIQIILGQIIDTRNADRTF